MATRASNATAVFTIDITSFKSEIDKLEKQTLTAAYNMEKGLRQASEAITAGLKNMKANMQFTPDFRAANSQLRDLISKKRDLEKAKLQLDVNEAKNKIAGLKGEILAAVGTAYTMAKPVTLAVDYEDAFADIKKVANFENDEQMNKFSEDLKKLATQVAIAPTELTKIAAAGAQQGIDVKDLLMFTELTAKGAIAFDMSCEDIGTAFGKLSTSLKIPLSNLRAFGDAVNMLSNTHAAKSSEIINAMMNKGGAAGLTQGFKESETAAFVTALIESGSAAEVAGNAFASMVKDIGNVGAMTAKQKKVIAELGLSLTDLKKGMKMDAAGTTLEVLRRLSEKENKSELASNLFGNEFDSRILAMNIKSLMGMLKDLNDKTKIAANSLESEFAARLATTKNALKQMLTAIQTFAINIGSQFLPALKSAADYIRETIQTITEFAKRHEVLIGVLTRVIAGFAAFKIAVLAGRVALALFQFAALGTLKNLALMGYSLILQTARFTMFTAAAGKSAVVALIGFARAGTLVSSTLGIIGTALTGLFAKVALLGKAFMLTPWGRGLKIALVLVSAVSAGFGIASALSEKWAARVASVLQVIKDGLKWVVDLIAGAFEKAKAIFSWFKGDDLAGVSSEVTNGGEITGDVSPINEGVFNAIKNLNPLADLQGAFGAPTNTNTNSQTINDYGVVNVNVQTGANAQEIGAAVSKARQNNWSFQ